MKRYRQMPAGWRMGAALAATVILIAGIWILGQMASRQIALGAGTTTPFISSSTHPDENNAYASNDPQFSWVSTGIALKGSLAVSGNTYDSFVSGNYAYAASGGSGLHIINIANPASPSLIATLDTPGWATGVAVAGNYAYVAGSGDGLHIINIANPASPVLTATYDTPGYATEVAVAGNFAYVADSGSGLQVIDVTNPASPSLEGTMSGYSGYPVDIAISGNRAYLAADNVDLMIVDIANPASPVLRGTYDDPATDVSGVAVAGNYAYIASNSKGLQVVDVSSSLSPVYKGYYDTPGAATGVTVYDNTAYVTDSGSGLHAIDVTNPAAPALISSHDTPGTAMKPFLAGDHVYVSDNTGGLQVVDISRTTKHFLKGAYDSPDKAYGVALKDKNAYLANGTEGLQIISFANPAAPALKGSYNTTGDARGVAVSGNHAFLADGASGLQIVDITNPAGPLAKGVFNTSGNAEGVAVAGNYAYVADGTYGLEIINVTDPTTPQLAGSRDTPGWANGVAVAGNYAYIADGTYGLRIVDITNPAGPLDRGSYNTTGYAEGVAVAGSYAYVADGGAGLRIINVSNPDSPVVAGGYDTPGNAREVSLSGNYAYIADDGNGLVVVDVSNPASPVLKDTHLTADKAYGVVAANGNAYVAAFDKGLQILTANYHIASSYALDRNPVTVPDTTAEPAGDTKTYTDVGEGDWYFHLRLQSANGVWGDTAHRRVQVNQYPDRNYYFTWYDNLSSDNWVLMANRSGSPVDLQFGLNIAGQKQDLAPFAVSSAACPGGTCEAGKVPAGAALALRFSGLMGGPVKVGSLTGADAIVSQRILWPKGGSSMEEVLPIAETRLDSFYHWTWYDQQSPGYTNWIMVANPNEYKVYYTITIAGASLSGGSGSIEPGQQVTPTFPGVIGGPVKVWATRDPSGTIPAPIIASQRVLSGGGTAFNEAPGIPNKELSSDYLWTWYDNVGGMNWIMIANPNSGAGQKVYYQVTIAGEEVGTGEIEPGGYVTPRFAGVVGGPVEVKAWTNSARTGDPNAKVIASQRVVIGPSFGETMGYPRSALVTSGFHWTWYDNVNSLNWVMVSNTNSYDIRYEVYVAGVKRDTGGDVIPAGQSATPMFPGVIGGPVEVKAFHSGTGLPAPVMASQRVLFGGYFNEVPGSVID